MFCPQCGTQVPEHSAFCQECGAPVSPTDSRSPTPMPGSASVYSPVGATSELRPARRADGMGIALGVIAIVGAVAAVIGSLLPWAKVEFFGIPISGNGFDIGYLTASDGNGSDGLIVLVMGLAAGAVSIHYFFTRNIWGSVALLILGVGVAVLGGYNLGRLVDDVRKEFDVSGNDALDVVGEGLYGTIAGGAIIGLTAIVGCIRSVIGARRP